MICFNFFPLKIASKSNRSHKPFWFRQNYIFLQKPVLLKCLRPALIPILHCTARLLKHHPVTTQLRCSTSPTFLELFYSLIQSPLKTMRVLWFIFMGSGSSPHNITAAIPLTPSLSSTPYIRNKLQCATRLSGIPNLRDPSPFTTQQCCSGTARSCPADIPSLLAEGEDTRCW